MNDKGPHELVPQGADIEVTALNKLDYVFKFVEFKVQGQFDEAFSKLRFGFFQLIPQQLPRIFDEEEFGRLLNGGKADIDIGNLRKHTVYRAGYEAKQSYIKVNNNN